MINKKIKYILISGLLAVIIFPAMTLADNAALDKLGEVGSGEAGPYVKADATTISEIIGTAVSAFLALLGVIFLVLMLYAGYHWMTARGEEEKVEKAKDTITRAIIGLIIVVGAYAIWAFIFYQLIL